MSGLARFGVALLGCWLAGCAHNAAGMPVRWVRTETEHVVLRTNSLEGNAVKVAKALERSVLALDHVWFDLGSHPAGKLQVVHFREPSDYHEYGHIGFAGHFCNDCGHPFERRSIAVFHGAFEREVRELFQHEVVHWRVAHDFPGAPTWLEEGLTTFFSTLRRHESRPELILGGNPLGLVFDDLYGWMVLRGNAEDRQLAGVIPSFRTIVSLSSDQFYGDRLNPYSNRFQSEVGGNYLSAWSAMHVLMLDEPALRSSLYEWLDALYAGTEGAVFDRYFDGEELARLERAQKKFFRRRVTIEAKYPYPEPEPEVERLETLRPGEIALLEAGLRDWNDPEERALAERAVTRAIAEDPGHAEPYVWRAALATLRQDFEAAWGDLERAVTFEASPENLHALGRFLLETGRAKSRLDEVLRQLRPQARSGMQLELLVRHALGRGRNEEAVQLAAQSVALDSTCSVCFETGSRALAADHRYREAARALAVAMRLREGRDSSELEARRAELEALAVGSESPSSTPERGDAVSDDYVGLGPVVEATDRPGAGSAAPLPSYPQAALARALEGTVRGTLSIASDGNVTAADATGPEPFASAAHAAWLGWHFPARADGTTQQRSVTMTFRLTRVPERDAQGVRAPIRLAGAAPMCPTNTPDVAATEVIVKVRVNSEGVVDAAKIVRGHPEVNTATLDAVKTWRFIPATNQAGAPIAMPRTLRVRCVAADR